MLPRGVALRVGTIQGHQINDFINNVITVCAGFVCYRFLILILDIPPRGCAEEAGALRTRDDRGERLHPHEEGSQTDSKDGQGFEHPIRPWSFCSRVVRPI